MQQGRAGRRISRKIIEDLDGKMLEQLQISDGKDRGQNKQSKGSFDVVYETLDGLSEDY